MKSTDLARKDRDLKKARKKQELLERRGSRKDRSVGDYINDLADLFFYDQQKIYNINSSEDIMMLLEDMKEDQPEKQWNIILKKAIKKTKVADKDKALQELQELGDIPSEES